MTLRGLYVGVWVAAVVAVICFYVVRDDASSNRCHARGGVTWDNGAHCVLGHPSVVNTR